MNERLFIRYRRQLCRDFADQAKRAELPDYRTARAIAKHGIHVVAVDGKLHFGSVEDVLRAREVFPEANKFTCIAPA